MTRGAVNHPPGGPLTQGLRAITVYLPVAEVARLEREGLEEGRGGVSAQIRFVLAQRRRAMGPRDQECS